ncbi:MAG: CYTH domain-containing protein [Bacteroidales bacterium]|nr:CYTH domain-containing protein [Bacteroidales bacterium]
MGQEIERKFLVKGEFKSKAKKQTRIKQSYISLVPERTVRVRITNDKGFITIKGAVSASGVSRYEWEKEISVKEAEELFQLCETGIIDKTRFLVDVGKHTYEVDEFYGDNQGLVVAEIELSSEDELFVKPDWLGAEVTGDINYYNAMLMKNPFKSWPSK